MMTCRYNRVYIYKDYKLHEDVGDINMIVGYNVWTQK